MKMHRTLIAAFLTAAASSGCTSGAANEAERQAEVARPVSDQTRPVSLKGHIKSFEFLGCSGDWTDEDGAPNVWRTGSERRTYFLVRHADTCGYTIGSKPTAKLVGDSLELSYELSNTSGMLAACECEYWAKFELTDTPPKLKMVSVNGAEARLKGSLAER